MQIRLLLAVVVLFVAFPLSSAAFFESFFGSGSTKEEKVAKIIPASVAGDDKEAEGNIIISILSNGETKTPTFLELTSAQCEDANIAAASNNADLSFSLTSIVCSAAGLHEGCTLFNECGASIQACSQFSQSATKASLKHALSNVGATTVCDEAGHVARNNNGEDDNNVMYAVPKDKHFIWPGHHVGHTVILNHVDSTDEDGSGGPISLVTLSLSPRIFRIENFFTEMERDFFVKAHNDTSNPLLKRSTTGDRSSSKVFNRRTSDSAFDTNSAIASRIKRRGFEVARVLTYDEKKADGIQVLRYNTTNCYVPHLDYITYLHDYDSASGGSNRFVTIFLYLSDVEEGGETVFPLVETYPEASWQREMVSSCRSRLSIKAKKGQSILFYNQNPDGTADSMSKHGGCPVIKGQKWAANLWIWNDVRAGYAHTKKVKAATTSAAKSSSTSTSTQTSTKSTSTQATQTGSDSSSGSYELYWKDILWGSIETKPLRFNSFPNHVWNVKPKGSLEIVASYTVTNREEQVFVFFPPLPPPQQQQQKKKKATSKSQSTQTEDAAPDLKSIDLNAVRTPEEMQADAIAMATASRRKRNAAKAKEAASRIEKELNTKDASGQKSSTSSSTKVRKSARPGSFFESNTIKSDTGHALGGQNLNPDGTARDPTDLNRFPRNRAVLPGSRVYTQSEKDKWDNNLPGKSQGEL
eukprot:GSChrysophyteH2.ASY1.ANO1.802.1 assembled CDS